MRFVDRLVAARGARNGGDEPYSGLPGIIGCLAHSLYWCCCRQRRGPTWACSVGYASDAHSPCQIGRGGDRATTERSSGSRRVVLLTPLGSLSAIPPGPRAGQVLVAWIILPSLVICSGSSLASVFASERLAAQLDSFTRGLALGLSALILVTALAVTVSTLRSGKAARSVDRQNRAGIAVLLEMARTWPASRNEQLELIVAGFGGQSLDFAVPRVVQSMALFGQESVPTLFLLLFAPGLVSSPLSRAVTAEIWRNPPPAACGSLIGPHRGRYARLGLWPEKTVGWDLVALVGAAAFETGAREREGRLRRSHQRRSPRYRDRPAMVQGAAQIVGTVGLRDCICGP